MSFHNSLQFGKTGETYIAQWLRHVCKYHVLPVYEKVIDEGKGPTLFAQAGQVFIAPDLLAFRTDPAGMPQVKWVEAKTKSAFSWHRLSQQWVTGIDLRHYADYLKVCQVSPFPVWLLFLHLNGTAKDTPRGMVSPTGLFGGELMYLSEHESHRHANWGKSGMVYWGYSTLTPLATLEQMAIK